MVLNDGEELNLSDLIEQPDTLIETEETLKNPQSQNETNRQRTLIMTAKKSLQKLILRLKNLKGH